MGAESKAKQERARSTRQIFQLSATIDMASKISHSDGRSKSKGKWTNRHHYGRGEVAEDDVRLISSGARRSRRSKTIDDILKNEEDGVDAIEMTPSKDKFREEVLASVGLDDDASGSGQAWEKTEPHRLDRGKPGMGYGIGREDGGIDEEIIELFEEGGGSSEEDDEECEEDQLQCESFDHSTENEPSWGESIKRIVVRILWIIVSVAAIVYIFSEDEMLEESEIDEHIEPKEAYSYMGYKDARIPDDDIAQYGGGLIGGEVFGISEDETDENESDPLQDEVPTGSHEPTGIVEIDLLWEQLSGYSEMAEPYDSNRELPVFWHVPKSGGTTLQDLMVHCIGMVGANEIGGPYSSDTGPLEIVRLENGNRYVNVDTTTPEGIAHAKNFGFSKSGLANVVLTSRFDDAASLFDDNYKGRCFTLLRHPIKRAISLFYYLKDATWEHSYSEVYKNMTIEEFAVSQYAEDNWMVRFLTNQISGGLYQRHIDLAKEIIESKCLVGILEEMKLSFKRFNQYFGWNQIDFGGPVPMNNRGTCVGRVITHPDNQHSHPTHEEGGEVWNLIMQKNQYDMMLYEHALHLFHDVQGELMNRQ